mgnify:CR=1 FL=1
MFKSHILEFNDNILGLRDFVDLIDPFLNERFKEHDKFVQPLLISGFINKMKSSEELTDKEKQDIEKLEKKINEILQDTYEEIPDVELEIQESKPDSGDMIMKLRSGNDIEIGRHIERANKTHNHIELLYKNSLISLLTSVEWFFSQVLHFYYDKYPESANIQNRTLTLTDLKGFDSINDAQKYLIDIKVEEILRSDFANWINLLKKELKLGLGYIEPVENKIIEIYQRRNLLVHNGGIVNSIYVSKVDKEFRENINLGDTLKVDKEYLDNSIAELQKGFILIASELWKKLYPDDIERGEVLGVITYENLTQSRWNICEGLTYFSINDSGTDSVDRVVAQLNYWLCKKRTVGYEEIEEEVEKIDFSDKKEIFQLGLFAIKGDKDKFFKTLDIALETNQLNAERLEEFPIFEEMRDTQEYKDFKSASSIFDEKSEPVDEITSEVKNSN